MTTITKERLLTIKQWRETYGPGSNVVLPAEEAEELARIALASLEAKPIGAFHIAEQQVDGTSDYLKDGEWPIDNGIIEVYAVPPAPVPLTEVQRAMLHDMDVEISAELEEEEEIYRDGIRKCIAALRYHHKRAETCSNGYTGSTLEEDTLKSINFLKRNNIAAMLHGSEPVTTAYKLPDGWISCSERMPDTKTAVLVAVEFGRKGDWRMKWATYIPGHPDANDGWIIPGASWKPSHWMPLPEPPL
ncbi:TPA: DUF551 domain-containing protein [Escherichia coli]|uniref:DUF551 domain-containing protein n=1 Tax=Escherichia coli TaxID=562 RepID=UPI0018B05309|nr:DUF551 domain-containing protein [Escherichia coli]EES0567624.1 DUF551 domain-containing protein [Escherichia coli]EIG6189154.1 DUF551 domain-containing protein [Escherichia coli]EJU0171980.1 DUF551 domain-containing protein [Escherichia coli]EKE5234623.1 DUF551 domain-containing protein [Escherichia coli]EKE5268835.1 DUF551 domain-containing protein [Escherichia coli]